MSRLNFFFLFKSFLGGMKSRAEQITFRKLLGMFFILFNSIAYVIDPNFIKSKRTFLFIFEAVPLSFRQKSRLFFVFQ